MSEATTLPQMSWHQEQKAEQRRRLKSIQKALKCVAAQQGVRLGQRLTENNHP